MKPVYFSKMFAEIRRSMRIPDNFPATFKLARKKINFVWEDPLKQGITIKADDENFSGSENGLFYKGKRVLLYIQDQPIYYHTEGKSNYKFHVTWCRTLDKMHHQQRYDKYVVSTNTEGIFSIRIVDGNKIVKQIFEPLHVCKNCLFALNWHGYAKASYEERQRIYDDFNLNNFFSEMNDDNASNFAYTPEYTDMTAPPNIYPADWNTLSKMYKELRHWTCAKCNRIMSFEERNLLHVHHRNGRKDDCSPANLIVLCADCHQKEHPDHKIFGSSNF